jgi:hypothetical protein
MADDRYIEVKTETRHRNTASGCRYDLGRCYRAVGNKVLSSVSNNDLYTFIAARR